MAARVREWIRSLSFGTEFAFVLLVAFGWPLGKVLHLLLTPEWWASGNPPFTNAHLLATLVFEALIGSVLWSFLTLRGWSGARVGLSLTRPSAPALLRTALVAIGLAVAAYLANAALALAATSIWPDLLMQAYAHRAQAAPGLPITTLLAVSLVNPVFEEVFVCGYIVSTLRDRIGVAQAVNVSAGIRVAYHLYQGPVAVLGIVPFALILTIWFARTRRLAPLILAHALVDFVGLSLASYAAT